MDPFWAFLTWPSGQILKLPLPLDYKSKITYTYNMCRTTFM